MIGRSARDGPRRQERRATADRRSGQGRRKASVEQRLVKGLWFAYHRATLKGWNEPFVGHTLKDASCWLVPEAEKYEFTDAKGRVLRAQTLLATVGKRITDFEDGSTAGDTVQSLVPVICAQFKATPIDRRSEFDRRRSERRGSRNDSGPQRADGSVRFNAENFCFICERRRQRRLSSDRRSNHERRKSPVIKKLTKGLWYAYHRATLLGIDELFDPGSQQLVFDMLFQEVQKYRFSDEKGTECEQNYVLSTAVSAITGPLRKGVSAGGFVCELVAALDIYDVEHIDRRSAFDRRQRERRNPELADRTFRPNRLIARR